MALGIGGITNLNLRTIKLAEQRTASLIRLMKKNKKLMYDYDVVINQDRIGWYIVNNTHLVAGSYETGLRSILDDDFKRIKVAINDDLFHKNSVKSQTDNKRVKDFVDSEVGGMLEPDGLSITFGNSISKDCPIVLLKEEHPYNHFSCPACDADGHTNWVGHSIYTDEYWVEFQKTVSYDVWQGEYMDTPIEKGEIFQPEWLRGVNINTIKIITSLSAIDPSFGKSPEACDKGIATLGITDKKKFVMLDIYIRKEDYANVFDYVDALRFYMPAWKVLLFENDFNQFYIAQPYYMLWAEKRNKVLPIQLFSSKTLKTAHYGSDKDSRIMNLVFPHQSGSFLYNSEIMLNQDFKDYKNQFVSYGASKTKLDGLDAAATAFIMLSRYKKEGNFKSLSNRQMKNNSFLNDY